MSPVTIFPTTLVCGADRLGVAASSITSSALAEFAHEALHMIERNDHLAAEARLQAVSDVRQMLDEEGAKLRANPDLDPVRRTRALAEFMREDRRAIEVHNRLAAKAVRRFDFAATLEAIWEEKKPEIERRRQQILAEVAARRPTARGPPARIRRAAACPTHERRLNTMALRSFTCIKRLPAID
jgi:hypothetical protein